MINFIFQRCLFYFGKFRSYKDTSFLFSKKKIKFKNFLIKISSKENHERRYI